MLGGTVVWLKGRGAMLYTPLIVIDTLGVPLN